MCASFMVDPLGLRLIDQIGVDKVMWSSDYPHNESTFGYSEKSLAAVVEAVGPENAVKIVSTNIKKFLGLGARGFDDDDDVLRVGRHRARHSRTARPRPDVPRDRRAPAVDHEGEGRRRPRPARQRQRRVRDGCELAAARRGPVARGAPDRGRAGRRRASASVHAVPRGRGIGVGAARRPRARAAVSRIRRGGRAFREGARRAHPRRCDHRGRRDDRSHAPRRGPAVSRRDRRRTPPWWWVRPSWRRRPIRSPASARRAGSPKRPPPRCRRRWCRGCVRSICRRSSSGGPSNSVPPPTCSRPSGR